MSRSFKKTPICNDSHVKTTKKKKNIANRRIRNKDVEEEVPSGKTYRKYTSFWEIRDWADLWTWNQAKIEYESGNNTVYWKHRFPTLKEFYRFWRKCYLNK